MLFHVLNSYYTPMPRYIQIVIIWHLLCAPKSTLADNSNTCPFLFLISLPDLIRCLHTNWSLQQAFCSTVRVCSEHVWMDKSLMWSPLHHKPKSFSGKYFFFSMYSVLCSNVQYFTVRLFCFSWTDKVRPMGVMVNDNKSFWLLGQKRSQLYIGLVVSLSSICTMWS